MTSMGTSLHRAQLFWWDHICSDYFVNVQVSLHWQNSSIWNSMEECIVGKMADEAAVKKVKEKLLAQVFSSKHNKALCKVKSPNPKPFHMSWPERGLAIGCVMKLMSHVLPNVNLSSRIEFEMTSFPSNSICCFCYWCFGEGWDRILMLSSFLKLWRSASFIVWTSFSQQASLSVSVNILVSLTPYPLPLPIAAWFPIPSACRWPKYLPSQFLF